jgi:hypothetical protein
MRQQYRLEVALEGPGEGRRRCGRRCAVDGHELGVSQRADRLGSALL